jgi:hypothetical protein
MADYYPLIARAVAGLDKNTGEGRRALYERARTALVAQLRGITPPLQEAEITRERLALEEAIRKVEAEAARRLRADAPPPPGAPAARAPGAAPAPSPQGPPVPAAPRFPPAAPPPGAPATPAGAPPASPPRPAAPSLPPAPAKPGRPPLEQGAAPASPAASPPPRGLPPRDPFADAPSAHDFDRLVEPRLADEHGERDMHGAAPGAGPDPFRDAAPPPRGLPPRDFDEEHAAPPRKGRALGAYLKPAIAVVLLLAIAGLIYSQRDKIVDIFASLRGSTTQVARDNGTKSGTQTQSGRPKITDRIGSQDAQTGPAVAQRVVLYEEEPNDPQGKRFVGSAIWRTETVSPGPGRPPELAIRADVEIPERRMTMVFSIRRNTDQTLPASHTIEVVFNLPADFPGGGISNVPGVLMKQAEQTRGTPLAGLAVKVTNNFFLIGLSAVESDQTRNIQLLKERAWFDIPVVYNNNRRAIIAIEKGTPGERAFAEAFAAWKQ